MAVVLYLMRKSIYYRKRLEIFLLLFHAVIAMDRELIKVTAMNRGV
jgi:hypothetical protein